jgi:DNA-binding MarR family transcriptional regulator
MAEQRTRRVPRHRNSVLASLEIFRSANGPRSFASLILFLYACENEGLTVSELAELADMPVASASRLIRSLAGSLLERERGADPPLFRLGGAGDRRLKTIWLTEDGRAMCDALEALIAAARPIRYAA